MWKERLHEVYANEDTWAHFAEMYGLHTRLGYKSIREAWKDNPLVQGSTDPRDYKKVDEYELNLPFVAVCDDYHEFDAIKRHFALAGLKLKYKDLNKVGTSVLGFGHHAIFYVGKLPKDLIAYWNAEIASHIVSLRS